MEPSSGDIYVVSIASTPRGVMEQQCLRGVAFTCLDSDAMDEIMACHCGDLVDNISSVMDTYGFSHANIDFEFMRDTNSITGEDNTEYLLEVLAELHDRGYRVSIDVAGDVETVYRDSRLAEYLDFVFLMGYDYHWSTAPTTGPVSPLLSSVEMDVEDSLDILDDYYPRDKIILGLPLYGYDWPAFGPDPYTATLGPGAEHPYSEIMANYTGYGVLWDDTGHVPWIRCVSNGEWRQIWFDNATSLAIEDGLCQATRLRGLRVLGFWLRGRCAL